MGKKSMKYVTSKDGTKIAYEISGSGPVLINITGASVFRNFSPVLQAVKTFSQNFTIYNYDRRGRGNSSDTKPYSTEKEVDDIEALIDAAGGKANLYGHSSGAVLALETALKLGKKVKKVVIYDAPYVHNEAGKEKYKKLANKVLTLLSEGSNKRAMKTFLSGIGMPKFFVWLLPLSPGWKTMHTLAPTLAYDIELTKDFPPLERFKDIKTPTRIFVGSKSPENIRTVGPQIAEVVPNAVFEEIDGQDHMVSAKVLLPKFKTFLDK